jgi:hypothetical protein
MYATSLSLSLLRRPQRLSRTPDSGFRAELRPGASESVARHLRKNREVALSENANICRTTHLPYAAILFEPLAQVTMRLSAVERRKAGFVGNCIAALRMRRK